MQQAAVFRRQSLANSAKNQSVCYCDSNKYRQHQPRRRQAEEHRIELVGADHQASHR